MRRELKMPPYLSRKEDPFAKREVAGSNPAGGTHIVPAALIAITAL